MRATRRWPAADFGEEVPDTMRMLARIAGVAAGAWLVYAAYTSPLTAVGWLAMAMLWLGGWYAAVRTSATKKAGQVAQVCAEEDDARTAVELAAATTMWDDILTSSGLALRVAESHSTRAGYVLGVEPVDDTKPVSHATLQARLGDLTVKAAAVLARTGVTLRAGDIRVEETEAAHVHLIHVCTRQVLALSIPFEPIAQPTTIVDPIDPALYEDGRPVEIVFGGEHGGVSGKIVGATGSGKSVLTNCIIGRLGECVDCLVGVVASDKLVPLIYPWVRPWLDGRASRPGIDFAAGQSPAEVLRMLALIYRVVRERNNRLASAATHVPTAQAPAIVLIVEEAADMAKRTDKIVTYDGQRMGFSQLVHEITRAGRSAQVSLLLLNQTDLYGASGEYGPEIARNTPLRICLKTLAPQDGMSVLPGLSTGYADTSRLRHNSMLVQPSIEEPRVMRAKSYKLTGDDIHDVTIRNSAWRPDLEPDLVALLGEDWTGRWDAARVPELAAAAQRDGLRWPAGQSEDEMDVELRRLLDAHTTQEPASAAAENAATTDAEFPDAQEGVDRLTEIASRIETPLTLPEPLASVMGLLAQPGAPRDWVATVHLAALLGRIDESADRDAKRDAARKLGREMSAIDPEIRSVQRERAQGYEVPTLHRVAKKIARGGGS